MSRISAIILTVALAMMMVACAIPSWADRPAPTINSISPAGVTAGSPGFTLTVMGSNFSPSSVVAWNGSARATTFVSKSQLLAAILSADVAQVGTAKISVASSNANWNSAISNTFAMTITASAPLQIVTSSLPAAVVETPYNADVANSGGVPPYSWKVVSGQLPPGLALGQANGVVSGVPGQKGSYSFVTQVTDSSSEPQSASKTINMSVTAPSPLLISTAALPNGTAQVAYNATIAATGGSAPYAWSIVSGALPPGLALGASTGVISGTPTQTGGYTFTVQIRDSEVSPQTATNTYSITVAAPAVPALQITTSSLPGGSVQVPYSAALAATGGTAPYTWSVVSGSLPTGLSLNASTGVISGIPSVSSQYSFSVQVKDAAASPQSASKVFTLSVAAPALQITSSSLPGGQVQVAYNAMLTASGGIAPYTWGVAAGLLPPGLGLNASTGAISGTPTQAGAFTFTARVNDSVGQSVQQSLAVNIAAAAGSSAPVLSSASPLSGPISGGTLVTVKGANFQPGAIVFVDDQRGSNVTVSSSTQLQFATPAYTAGTYPIQVTNPNSQYGVLPAAFTYLSALQITTTSLPGGQQGTLYQVALSASGGTQPYTWSLVSGSLPPGLTLASSTGQISGAPSQAGTFAFVAYVNDAVGSSTQRSLSINIAAPGSLPLGITTTFLSQAQVSQPYSATLQATGGTGGYTWGVVSGQLPPGLSLMAASGQITGTPGVTGQFTFTVQASDSASPPQTANKSFTLTVSNLSVLDQYGGVIAAASPNGATGYWRVEKFGNGWFFVTPDGHAFWSLGVFDVAPDEHVDDLGNTHKNRVIVKYGDADKTWGPQTVRRLQSWGFNTVLDHSVSWVRPTQTCGGCPGWSNGQPAKVPQVWFTDGASYPIRNAGGYGTGHGKDIFVGVNTAYYNGYVAPNTDPFDPNFASWITGYMNSSEAATAANSPWTIGFSLGEMDYLWGFGSGSSTDFSTVPSGHNTPHIGWIVLITKPNQTSNPTWGITYTDTTVYAKQALKNFLQGRYSTIGALNTAWGSNYTTFDSAGGWGPGTGLMDEDGRHAWVGNYDTLASETVAMQKDLNDFLFQYASKWFQTQHDALKAKFPNMMYFGPNVLGAWGTPPRKQILQAAALYIDVLMTSVGTLSADDQARLDFTIQYLGDKPIAPWVGFPANTDSGLWRYGNPNTALSSSSQAQRGQYYSQVVNWLWNATVSSSVPGAAGSKPYVGLRWWALTDNPAEKANWGLVSTVDNAYDGLEATVSGSTTPGIVGSSTCKDAWGYPCGAEEHNYGNFLGSVRSANLSLMQALAAQPKR